MATPAPLRQIQLPRGVVLLANDAEMMPDAESAIDEALGHFDVVTGDSLAGRSPIRRPGHSPERLLAHDCVGPLLAIRHDRLPLVEIDETLDDATVYGAALSARHAGLHHGHLSRPLTLVDPDRLDQAGIRVPNDAAREAALVQRYVPDASVEYLQGTSSRRVRRALPGDVTVDVVIPTRGSRSIVRGAERVLVLDAVRSVFSHDAERLAGLYVVADADTPEDVCDALADVDPRVRVLRWNEPFNFSRKVNFGVAHGSGDVVIALNDDVEIISTDWMVELASLALLDGVGCVGPLLLYEDATVQSAGHAHLPTPVSMFTGSAPSTAHPQAALQVVRECASVTGAALATRRRAYVDLGGLCDALSHSFNDVDFGSKVRSRGDRCLFTPHARLFHFESRTRDPAVHHDEVALAQWRLGSWWNDDPYWRPDVPEEDFPLGPPDPIDVTALRQPTGRFGEVANDDELVRLRLELLAARDELVATQARAALDAAKRDREASTAVEVSSDQRVVDHLELDRLRQDSLRLAQVLESRTWRWARAVTAPLRWRRTPR